MKKPKKRLTPEERLSKKQQRIAREARASKVTLAMYGITKPRQAPKKHDPFRDG